MHAEAHDMITHSAEKALQPLEPKVQAVAYRREAACRNPQESTEANGPQGTHLPESLTCTSQGLALRSFSRVALPVRSRR